jgi:hypothetical protein
MVILLTGCFPVYINHEYPEMYKNNVGLEQLIGQDKQFVLDKFGKPHQHLTDGTDEYYIYRDSVGGNTEVIFLAYMLLPFASETKGDLKCLLFTINEKNIIREYQIKSAGNTDDLSRNYYDIYCKNAFWEKEQLEKIESLSGT